MMGVCRRYTRDKMDAEDLVQDGFIQVFKEIEKFRNGSLEGWMRRIFVNLCIDRYRRNSRRNTWLIPDSGDAHEVADPNYEIAPDFLEEAQLLAFINQLPEGSRMVFNLFAVEGYSHSEIARMLQITESTSRVQVTRARKLLQGKLVNHTERRP